MIFKLILEGHATNKWLTNETTITWLLLTDYPVCSRTVIVLEGYRGQNIHGHKPESLRAILRGLGAPVHTHCSTPTCSKCSKLAKTGSFVIR